jgi:hypothetical protein
LMKEGLSVSSYVKKRPSEKIPYKEICECIKMTARKEHSRGYKSIRKELADKNN